MMGGHREAGASIATRKMKISESLQQLIAELEESDRRLRQKVDGLVGAADRIIESVDRALQED